MKLTIVLAILALSQVHYTNSECDDVIIHGIHYEKEILVNNTEIPFQLAIDHDTNTLFFSYTKTDRRDKDMYASAFINLKTNEHKTISGTVGGFANTVDYRRNVVYLGGQDGLYEFDYETGTAKHIEGTSNNIWSMFFKNNVYYCTFPGKDVYVFQNGNTEIVPELADQQAKLVALNNDLDFYFFNSSGLFKVKKSSNEILGLGDYSANGLIGDDNNHLYFSTRNGIYFIDENDNIVKIATLADVFGVAIQSNRNIIYSTSNAIVRLKPTKSPC